MKPWPGLMYYDPEFYTYLKLHMADDLLFCYRFLLFIYYHSDYLTRYLLQSLIKNNSFSVVFVYYLFIIEVLPKPEHYFRLKQVPVLVFLPAELFCKGKELVLN